jgi:hypothetical protein
MNQGEFHMQTCNRRGFLTRVMAGTAALAIVGRAAAEGQTRGDAPSNGKGPGDGNDRTCAHCAYFTVTPGSTSGTCGYRDGQAVPADGGCGAFK